MKTQSLIRIACLVAVALAPSCQTGRTYGAKVPITLQSEPATARKYLVYQNDWDKAGGAALLDRPDRLEPFYLQSDVTWVGDGSDHIFIAEDGPRRKYMPIHVERVGSTNFFINLNAN